MKKEQPISILIIEDNPGDQLLLHENLLSTQLFTADILIADTLAEGFNFLRKQSFALIFLDLFLPDSRGLDTFFKLIKFNSHIPVVIYSGLSDTQIAVKAIAAGAQDFLIKGDYSVSLLEKTIRYSIERKHASDALEESNNKYDLLSKATHDMVWDWNLLTGEVFRSPEGWKKIFGSAEGGKPGTRDDLVTRVHPEDRQKLELAIETAINTQGRQLYECEFRIIRDDGTTGCLDDRGYIVRDEAGKATRLIGASHDITDRKNAEEELKKLSLVAKETINGVVLRDKNQQVIWVNNAFTKIYGYTFEEIIGKNSTKFLHGPETDDKIMDEVQQQLIKNEPSVYEIINYTKTGNKILVRIQVQPIFDEHGDYKQSFSLLTDITVQKELEEKVELEKINKQKEITEAVFAAQESGRSEIGRELHDNVNQLLGATRLYIDMARRNEEERDSFLITSSEYVLMAIEEIRKLSKVLITPLINDIGLVDAVKDLLNQVMLVHPVKIIFNTDSFKEAGLSNKFKLNIFRIVQEQINNTLKHAQAEKIIISFKENNDGLMICVSDDGIGFDTTQRKSGVGITNIKSRSGLYNGHVHLTSEPGKGTRLAINFNSKDYLSAGSNHIPDVIKSI